MQTIVLTSAEKCVRFMDGEVIDLNVTLESKREVPPDTRLIVICRLEGSSDRRLMGIVIKHRLNKTKSSVFPTSLISIKKI